MDSGSAFPVSVTPMGDGGEMLVICHSHQIPRPPAPRVEAMARLLGRRLGVSHNHFRKLANHPEYDQAHPLLGLPLDDVVHLSVPRAKRLAEATLEGEVDADTRAPGDKPGSKRKQEPNRRSHRARHRH